MPAYRVMGIDCSTNSFAYAIIENGVLKEYDDIRFGGDKIFDRLLDAKKKISAMRSAGKLSADLICVESAVMVRNIDVAIAIAYFVGAVLAEIMERGVQVFKVTPMTWQTAIGNPTLKKPEKEQLMSKFPNQSKSWYTAKTREIRKQRTLDFANTLHHNQAETNDNIGDAIAIAYYAWHNLRGA